MPKEGNRIANGAELIRRSTVILALSWLCFVCLGRAQTDEHATARKKAEMREQIATVIRQTIKDGEFEVYGGKAWFRRYPSNDDDDKIKRYGEDAVPIVQEYLKAKDVRERSLAIRLLGVIGGKAIVAPLRTVIQNDSPSMRRLALTWLAAGAPWEDAYPILRDASEKDPEPSVRNEAQGLLNTHGPH